VHGSDVRVHVVDDHADASVVTVSAAPAGHKGLAVELVNSTVLEYPDARDIEDIPETVVPRTVSLRPIGDGVESRTYRWNGTQNTTALFENVPRNTMVFYSVGKPTGNEPMQMLGRLTCGPETTLTEVTIRINVDGSIAAGNNCQID
jgi:hypothetical protein